MKTAAMIADLSLRSLRFLGRGFPKVSIITSALLAADVFFYVFVLGSYLQPTIYFFLKRFTYIKTFNENIISPYYDSIVICTFAVIWLFLCINGRIARVFVPFLFGLGLAISILADLPGLKTATAIATLPVIAFLLLFQKKTREHGTKKALRNFSLNLSINYLVITAIILGVLSILISLSVIAGYYDIPVDKILTTKHIPVDNYGYELFVLFSTVSPILLIVIFFALPGRLFIQSVLRRIPQPKKKSDSLGFAWSEERSPRKKLRILSLSLILLFSASLSAIPQLSTINNDNQQIGSDSDSYAEWITHLRQTKSLQDFLKVAFIDIVKGDRPLALILLYLITTAINGPTSETVEYVTILLGPALVLVVYFFTRELTLKDETALVAASLTGLGYFQISMGIYAGFYANWIALVVGYLSLIFFFRFLRTRIYVSGLMFFALFLVMLFCHAYTWTVFTLAVSAFLIVSILFRLYPIRSSVFLLLLVASCVVIDVVKTAMVESLGASGGVKLTYSLAQRSLELKSVGAVWDTLVDATQHHFGGIFCNIIILGLVIYWLACCDLHKDFNIFIMVFLAIGIPALFLGDWILQSRVFYNIPFQIPAAISLTYLLRQKNTLRILTPIYVWLVAISIWTVSNFYEVKPS